MTSSLNGSRALDPGIPDRAQSRFTVGSWIVDPGAHEIIRHQRSVRLEPRVMRLLVVLAARAGGTVTRDELFRTVWDGEHVEPNALNRSISQLRKAFGDDAREPRIIRTIPRRGYRLDASVTFPNEQPVVTAADRRLPRSRLFAAAIVVGMVAAAAAVRPWESDAITPLATRPVTSLMGLETWPALSPDGERLAFVWSGDQASAPGLYVQRIGEDAKRPVADSGSFASPVWAPGGERLAFLSTGSGRCSVMIWSPTGGTSELAACAPDTRPGLAWSPDQQQLALAEPGKDGAAVAIVLVSTLDGTRRRVTEPPPGTLGDGEPTFDPSGTLLAFTRYRSRTHHDVHVVDLESGAVRRITQDERYVAGHAWSRDGSTIVLSSNRSGNFRLWQIPATGGTPRWLNTIGTYDPGRPTVAARATRLAYSEWYFEYNVWITSAGGDEGPTRVIASTRWDRQPQWSPDGHRLVFVSDRTGNDELWVSHADGSALERLTAFGDRPVSSPSWSPDGRHVAFHLTTDSGTDVYTLTLGEESPQPVATSVANDEVPTWSRDGQSLFFASDRSGRWEAYRLALGRHAIDQITTEGGYFAREGPDGQVFVTRFAQAGLWRLARAGDSTPQRISIPLAAEDWGNWVVEEDGDVLFLDRSQTLGSEIVRWSARTGRVTTVIRSAQTIPFGAGQFSIRDDGMVAYSQTDRAESDIRLVEGFGLPPS